MIIWKPWKIHSWYIISEHHCSYWVNCSFVLSFSLSHCHMRSCFLKSQSVGNPWKEKSIETSIFTIFQFTPWRWKKCLFKKSHWYNSFLSSFQCKKPQVSKSSSFREGILLMSPYHICKWDYAQFQFVWYYEILTDLTIHE